MTDTQHPHDDATGQDAQTRAPVVVPPVTGDAGVDRVLTELQERLEDEPDDPVAAVTEAHRQLQARLTAPAPPAPPGQARPGPR